MSISGNQHWKSTNVQLAIVVGGGNIFRGRERPENVDQATADYMGMLATVINGMALQEMLERLGAPTRMMTAFEINSVAEPYIRRRAIRHLESCIKKLSYKEVLKNDLKVMDATAFALCMREKMPIIVFNIKNLKDLDKILEGKQIGTLVS